MSNKHISTSNLISGKYKIPSPYDTLSQTCQMVNKYFKYRLLYLVIYTSIFGLIYYVLTNYVSKSNLSEPDKTKYLLNIRIFIGLFVVLNIVGTFAPYISCLSVK